MNANIPGYHGGYLRVDLTSSGAEFVSLPESLLRKRLGGSGLGVELLLAENSAALDALAPAAPLVFAFSPLVGSPLTTSAKFAVVGKSPLTERVNDSLASSGFALAGKKSGVDALMLVGRAEEPSVLVVDDGKVRIVPAGTLWGMSNSVAQAELRRRFGPGFQFATIGPAGERLTRYATISHDGRHAGRGGSGAVLGSKNIKAIAVRGARQTEWARPEQLIEYARRLSDLSFGAATAKYRELGTASNLLAFNRLHVLPTRNFQQGSFAGAKPLLPNN